MVSSFNICLCLNYEYTPLKKLPSILAIDVESNGLFG